MQYFFNSTICYTKLYYTIIFAVPPIHLYRSRGKCTVWYSCLRGKWTPRCGQVSYILWRYLIFTYLAPKAFDAAKGLDAVTLCCRSSRLSSWEAQSRAYREFGKSFDERYCERELKWRARDTAARASAAAWLNTTAVALSLAVAFAVALAEAFNEALVAVSLLSHRSSLWA